MYNVKDKNLWKIFYINFTCINTPLKYSNQTIKSNIKFQ